MEIQLSKSWLIIFISAHSGLHYSSFQPIHLYHIDGVSSSFQGGAHKSLLNAPRTSTIHRKYYGAATVNPPLLQVKSFPIRPLLLLPPLSIAKWQIKGLPWRGCKTGLNSVAFHSFAESFCYRNNYYFANGKLKKFPNLCLKIVVGRMEMQEISHSFCNYSPNYSVHDVMTLVLWPNVHLVSYSAWI